MNDILFNSQNIRAFWQDFLVETTTMDAAVQPLRFVETNGFSSREKQNVTIEEYAYLTDPTRRIYLIEREEGIGKTTYVSKLAYNWATKSDPILRENFDFIML